MITRASIRTLCNSSSYTRGLEIYRCEEKILEFQVENTEKEALVKALVEGSQGKYYHVKMKYDKERDFLDSIYCECPAFHSYAGLCKHCVAVLLKYIDYCTRKKVIADYARGFGAGKAPFGGEKEKLLSSSRTKKTAQEEREKEEKKPLAQQLLDWKKEKNICTEPPAVWDLPEGRRGERRTSTPLAALMKNQRVCQVSSYMAPEIFGKVRLEPYLKYMGNSISAEFRIGVEKLYVLKDIFEFVWCMKEGRIGTYGKQLQFFHTAEAFTEETKKIAGFILDWERKNGKKYIQRAFTGRSYTGSYPKLRALPLTGDELADLLRILEKRPFYGWIGDGGEKLWQVTDGVPERQLFLTGLKDGIEVRMERISSVESTDCNIYFMDKKIYLVPKEPLSRIQEFVQCMKELPGNRAFIQKAHVPVFFREILPQLEAVFQVESTGLDVYVNGIEDAVYKVYLDLDEKNRLSCEAFALYGADRFSLFENEKDRERRDLSGELKMTAAICEYFESYDSEKGRMFLEQEEEKVYRLLTEGIPRIQEMAQVFVSEKMRKLRVVAPPKVKVGLSFASGLLDLEISVEGMDREEFMEILGKYDPRQKFYRLKNGSFLNLDHAQIQELLELREGLGLTERELKKEKLSLPSYRALYLDEQLKDSSTLLASRDFYFSSLIKNMKNMGKAVYEVPKEQREILKEYQKQGYLWMKILKQYGFGGILADDMGLGKTLQAITFLWSEFTAAEKGKAWRALIVTPASLVFNWANEIQRFAPDLPVKMVAGTAWERKEMLENIGEKEVLITSYELLRRDILFYEKLQFDCEIIDEAQYIKNYSTQSAKAVKSVQAVFRMALTGTPVENRLSELWSIFDYLMPGFLYGYERFRREIELPVIQMDEESAKARLQKMIRPFVLRRLKKDVLKELPDKLEKNVFSKMEGEQRRLYDAHVRRLQTMLAGQSEREFRGSRIQILAEMTKLRQICCHPGLLYQDYNAGSAKLETCLELIKNAINGGHKLLVFSQFTSMLDLVIQRLEKEKISFYVLTGTTPKEERIRLVNAFNQDETSVFCISLRAGGTGLNLTAADIVIHYDPWWNLAVQNQATDRAHRIGQEHIVSVYKLFAKDTIEEKIKRLQERKKELADEILSGDGMDSVRLSREEILDLLR